MTIDRHEIHDVAALRGLTIEKEWIDAHWDEMMRAMAPWCAKAATCYATGANTYLWCNDMVGPRVPSMCEMYPEDSEDRARCGLLSRVMWMGFDRLAKPRWLDVRECVKASAVPGERTLDVWIEPAQFDASWDGTFTVFAIDAATRVPVMARVVLEGQKIRGEDHPDGKPSTGLPLRWTLTWKRVPNADGHHDFAPPLFSVSAPGYRTVTFPVPAEPPRLVVEMTPKSLKAGRNAVTVAVRDAATGQPVEMRVMAGTATAGRSNEPFVLDVPPGSKLPEIWITSLFGRYADVVVAKGEP